MKKIVVILLLSLSYVSYSQQYNSDDVYDYIDKYKDLSITLMKEAGIPASIKLAQAIYASASGSSSLAIASNNHFGILCGAAYQGHTYMETNTNTCFRKYNTVEDSYRDHSVFIKSKSRYNKLFTYAITDYKSWAYGLQEAGYSSNPKYADNIIAIIETYYLQVYDKLEGGHEKVVAPAPVPASTQSTTSNQSKLDSEYLKIAELKHIEERKKIMEEQNRIAAEKAQKEANQRALAEFQAKEQSKMDQDLLIFDKLQAQQKFEFEAKLVREREDYQKKQQADFEKKKINFERRLNGDSLVENKIAKDTIEGIEVLITKKTKASNEQIVGKATVSQVEPTPQNQPQNEVKKIDSIENKLKIETEQIKTTDNNSLVFKARDFEYKPVVYSFTNRNVYENNKVKFIIAQKEDTYEKLAKEVQIPSKNLRTFNDIVDEIYQPIVGEVVYLEKKNKKSAVISHKIKEGESIRYIAQKYAIPLDEIYKRNGFNDEVFVVGYSVCLSCKKQ